MLTALYGITVISFWFWIRQRFQGFQSALHGLKLKLANAFPILLCVVAVRFLAIGIFVVPSHSMVPAIHKDDYLITNNLAYGIRLPFVGGHAVSFTPERGDIAVFVYPPQEDLTYVKRILGLPGDVVELRNDHYFVNDVPVQSGEIIASGALAQWKETMGNVTYVAQVDTQAMGFENTTWVVPEGSYFVSGDNRHESRDSRYWGFVTHDKLIGEVISIF